MNITAPGFNSTSNPIAHHYLLTNLSNELVKTVHLMKTFVFQIRYLTEVRNFQENLVKQKKEYRNEGSLIKNFMDLPHHPLRHQAKGLQDRVQLLSNSKIGATWNAFYEAATGNQSSQIVQQRFNELKANFPIEKNLEEFGDTDLAVCSHPITPNGITPVEFEAMQKKYKEYTSHLRYDVSTTPNLDEETLKTQVERDIRVRMSRKTGRDLTDRILAKIGQEILTIEPGEFSFTYSPPHGYEIGYSLTPDALAQIAPNGESRFIENPPFAAFSHEEIHFSNQLHNESVHDPDPDLDTEKYADSEELRTIKGFCRCKNNKHKPLPVHEDALRVSFDLFPRDSHLGYHAGATQRDQLHVVMRAGARAEFLDRLPEIASPDLDHAMRHLTQGQHGLGPETVKEVIEMATENQALRTGTILTGLNLSLESPQDLFEYRKKREAESAVTDGSPGQKKSKPSSSASSSQAKNP